MNRNKAMVLVLLAGSVLLSGCWWMWPPCYRRGEYCHDRGRWAWDHDRR